MNTVLLSESDIKSVMPMKDVVQLVDRTFRDMGEGGVVNPTKLTLDLGESADYPPYEGFMNAMPAYIGFQDSAGLKWVGGFLGERKKQGRPFIVGMILLIDPRTGDFKAVMDGAYITNMRTGAQTAAALKYLHPHKSIRLGIYGAGMQARTQTMAVSCLFDIAELRVYDIYEEAAKRFKEDMKDVVTGEIVICKDAKDAADADAVVSVTQSKDSFIKNDWIRPGSIYFPMGSYQECEDALLLGADKIVVDHPGQCLHRGALRHLAHEGKITEDDLTCTIGELAAGKCSVDLSNGERCICIPIGTGAMDIAVATEALSRAVERGLDTSFAFDE